MARPQYIACFLLLTLLISSDHIVRVEAMGLHNFVAGLVGKAVFKVVGVFFPVVRLVPTGYKFLGALERKRLERGDVLGAERVRAIQQWFSFRGLRKGVFALFISLWTNRPHIGNSLFLIARTANAWRKRAAQVGAAEAWQEQSQDIQQVAHVIITRLGAVVQVGPIRHLLRDVMLELQSETHLASDIVEIVIPGHFKHIPGIQSFLTSLRKSLEHHLSKDAARHEATHKRHHAKSKNIEL